MRWNVDVSPLEGGQAQSYCVEAESWQGALQAARRLRGDESRMAGFSIDITNEGCKAVDPAKKLRFEVKRTSDSTPLTPGAEAAPTSKRRISSPPRPNAQPTNGSVAPKTVDADRTIQMKAAAVEAPVPAAAPVAIPPILVSREQEATADVPLTYREYGFAFAPGTTEEAAVSALLQQLSRIQGVLAAAPAGKLVNLAAFDQMFQGRPPVLPIATLTWKDWKPEPAIGFPRRTHKKPASIPAPAPAPAPAPVAAPMPAPVVMEMPTPVVVAVELPPPVSQTREKPALPKRRVRGDELISVLFESMHDLNFLRDSIEGADFCLQLALEKLPSRIGIVWLYDIDRREFVIVAAHGVVPDGLVGRRLPETESTLSSAMRKRRAILLAPADIAEHAGPIGGAQHVLLAPVMQAGRFLGAIEIADAIDGVPFSELDANAITYMAEQYAEFVAARGVILDRERSSAPPAQRS
ncbi:MAG TPA: GAF domain-containing protein [Polyangiaceae bacterium]|jgi:hypothetical protein